MSSKQTKYLDSIGKGLLDDNQKYKTKQKQSEMIEMRQLSKRYDYVNLDEVQSQKIVVTSKKETKTQNAINKNQLNSVVQQKEQMKNKNFNSQINPPNTKEYQQNIYQQPPKKPQYPKSVYNPNQHPVYQPNIQYIQPNVQYQYPTGPRSSYIVNPQSSNVNPQTYNVNHQNTNVTGFMMNGVYYPANVYVTNVPQYQNQAYKKKSGVPEMTVNCNYCGVGQNIAGNNYAFICYRCHRKNDCFPLYNIIKCSSCNSQVCYRFGTSHLIKCTKCQSINEVPVSIEAAKNQNKQRKQQTQAKKQKVSLPQDKEEQEQIIQISNNDEKTEIYENSHEMDNLLFQQQIYQKKK